MRAGLFPVALAALCLFVACACAQVVSTFVQGGSGPAYVGPGDATAYNPAAVLGYYGVPCYSGAYAASHGNIWDLHNGTSVNTYTCLSNGGWDEAGAATFCAAGSLGYCWVGNIYNQSGGAWPTCTQGSSGVNKIVFSVQNSHAAVQTLGGDFVCTLGSAITLPYTVAHVIKPTATSAQLITLYGSSSGQIEIGESAGSFSLFNGTRLIGNAVSANTFYVHYSIFGTTTSGATDSALAANNATQITGNAGTSTGGGSVTYRIGDTYTGYFMNIMIDQERMNSTQLTGGYNNQKAGGVYW